LRGVQVLELAEEATSDPFSATEGYTAAKQEDDRDEFGLPPIKPSASVGSFIEDEVPF
jgi:hypothetical protein